MSNAPNKPKDQESQWWQEDAKRHNEVCDKAAELGLVDDDDKDDSADGDDTDDDDTQELA